jgi:hypothetical protein
MKLFACDIDYFHLNSLLKSLYKMHLFIKNENKEANINNKLSFQDKIIIIIILNKIIIFALFYLG